MPTQRIQFKEWLPDQPSILDAVSEVNNVIPLAVGYGPFKSAVNYSGSASENLTNVFATKIDNDVSVFAGGLTKLYKLDSTDLTLDDVSKSGGGGTDTFLVNGSIVASFQNIGGLGTGTTISFIVPNGATYSANVSSMLNVPYWSELR